MANQEINDLNELTSLADNDLLLAIDDSESNLAIKGKKLKYVTLKDAIAAALGTGDIKFPLKVTAGSATYNVVIADDNAITLVCNTAPNDINVVIPTLPQPTIAGNEWEITIVKTGDNKLTITPPSNARIGDLDINTAIENDYGTNGRYAAIKLKSIDTTIIAVTGGFKKWAEVGGSNVWDFSSSGGAAGSGITSSTSATILLDGNYRHNSNASPQTGATITFDGTGATGGVGGTMYHQASATPTFSASNGLTGANILQAQNYEYVVDVVNTITWFYDGENVFITNIVGGNSAPYATGLSVTGTEVVGNVMSANYTYNDADGDLEDTGSTVYKWYRANDDQTGQTEISGATSAGYTTTASDEDKIVGFAVKLFAQDGVTEGAYSDIAWSGVIVAATAGSDYDLEAEGNFTAANETGTNGTISELTAIGASGNKIVSLPDVHDLLEVTFSSVAAGNYEIWVLARTGSQSNQTSYNGSIDIVYNSIDRAYTLDEATIGSEVNVLGSSVFGYFKTDSAISLSGDVTIGVRANFAWSAVDAIKLKFIS